MTQIRNTTRLENTDLSDFGKKISVMIVDDSAIVRGFFARAIDVAGGIQIVASVGDGKRALEELQNNQIDVIVLDIDMPRMDGITALPLLKKISPKTEIIVASTLTKRNAEISIRALQAGATDFITKPTATKDITSGQHFQDHLISKIRILAEQSRKFLTDGESIPQSDPCADESADKAEALQKYSANKPDFRKFALAMPKPVRPKVIAIGSSTGGPQALFTLLPHLKGIDVPILITQHMPPTFTTTLAEHLSRQLGIDCVEAEENAPLRPGKFYIAPGDYHMAVAKKQTEMVIALNSDQPENFCRPAVDVMLSSLVEHYDHSVLAVILTGMGSDGKKGCEKLFQAGGNIIAQNQESSVVWGMPGSVSMAGLCCKSGTPEDLGQYISNAVSLKSRG